MIVSEVRVTKIMALTIEDLFRLLPVLTTEDEIQVIENRIVLESGLIIEFETLPPVEIGMMFMPRLKLEFRFDDWPANTIEEFIKRFNRTFQKGGG